MDAYRPSTAAARHLAAVVLALAAQGALAADLASDLGRNETRIYSGRFTIASGRTLAELDLPERLERRAYRRVRERRPTAPGEYFWGHERFWIYRRGVRIAGQRRPARLIGLELEPPGRILRGIDADGGTLEERHLWLEPVAIAESLEPNRALTLPVDYDELPEILRRSVLAAEDARFFDHVGLDARSLARAMLKNARAGRVVQGGSTITQQLVKLRDLSPKRSLGRKASEALRALALEAEHGKTEILRAYLDAVYYGHLDGVHLYGVGRAARTFFSKPVAELELAEAAVLAAMIQGPNRLSPVRNPSALFERYRWVLRRLEELGWAEPAAIDRARRRLPELRLDPPEAPGARHYLAWIGAEVADRAPRLARRGRGVVVHSTLDPLLQQAAADAVTAGLRRLESAEPRLRGLPLSASLVALDAASGDVLAYVGGDPRDRSDAFDRARRAHRQPGSAVKPLVLLEAFQRCGGRRPLYPARRVSDRPLSIELESGPWRPENPDRRFRDAVSIRHATVHSLNVPFVRVARWCGYNEVARRMRRAGLDLPPAPAPSFVLGALETTPLELAAAYTPLAAAGRRARPRPFSALLLPSGETLERRGTRRRKVTSAATAYLVRHLLGDNLQRGIATAGAFGDDSAFAKTGTSSSGRDAWFAGGAGAVVTVVWVGLDQGDLGLSGRRAAAPIWRAFMERAVASRPPADPSRPAAVVERWIEVETGLLTARRRRGTERELFRSGALPRQRRFWRRDAPIPPIDAPRRT